DVAPCHVRFLGPSPRWGQRECHRTPPHPIRRFGGPRVNTSERSVSLGSRAKTQRFVKSRPVISRNASRYFSLVRRTTSSGTTGPGASFENPIDSSQSRTNCLSNDGGDTPTRYSLRGQ